MLKWRTILSPAVMCQVCAEAALGCLSITITTSLRSYHISKPVFIARTIVLVGKISSPSFELTSARMQHSSASPVQSMSITGPATTGWGVRCREATAEVKYLSMVVRSLKMIFRTLYALGDKTCSNDGTL
jgi:hypothetical protein